jgi:hypothetical protein
MQFVIKTSSLLDLKYNARKKENTHNTKFLGLILDDTFSWKIHINYILPKLSSALLRNENNKASPIPGNIKESILFLLSFDHDLWDIILGKFQP